MDQETRKAILHDMLLARAFEERAAEEYTKGNIGGFLHLYPGEEAVAVGVLHAATPSDYVVTTYREHVHALVRGVPAKQIMAELFGRRDGCCHGMGGSMHLFDRQRHFMGGYGIVGETYPVATGIAYSIAMKNLPEVVLCFFGDGAVNQGTFHESLNMAALWRLPILFVCENNHYQIGTEIHRHSAVTDVYKRASAYQIPARQVNGMDVMEAYRATTDALEQIRAGTGPQLLEFETYRFRGHSMADPGSYRPKVEIQAFQTEDDPITQAIAETLPRYPDTEQIAAAGPDVIDDLSSRMHQSGHLDSEQLAVIKQQVVDIVEEAVNFANAAEQPQIEDLYTFLECNRNGEVLI